MCERINFLLRNSHNSMLSFNFHRPICFRILTKRGHQPRDVFVLSIPPRRALLANRSPITFQGRNFRIFNVVSLKIVVLR